MRLEPSISSQLFGLVVLVVVLYSIARWRAGGDW
jgi:hypothetical protein